jgi:hypothetical protein
MADNDGVLADGFGQYPTGSRFNPSAADGARRLRLRDRQ